MDDPTNNNPTPEVVDNKEPTAPVVPDAPENPEPEVIKDVEPVIEKTTVDKVDTNTDDDFDPYDADKVKGYVGKEIAKATEPVQDMIFRQSVDTKLNQILVENPEFAPYKEKIQKFVTHPNRLQFIKNGLPLKAVMMEALSDDLQRIGAEKAKKADADAQATKNGGTTPPVVDKGAVDYSKMSSSEVQRVAEEVKSGRYSQQ